MIFRYMVLLRVVEKHVSLVPMNLGGSTLGE
jgi:hypothetical protein